MTKFDSYYDVGPTSATFLVEVDGRPLGQFQEASGLSVTVEIEEVVEGGQNFHTHKLPGRFTFDNVRLTRGVTEDNGFLAWIDTTSAGAFEKNGGKLKRTTVAITLVSAAGKRLRTWTLQEAFPASWSGPDFSLSNDDFPMEELEIAHHGFTVTDHKAPAGKKKSSKKKSSKKKAPAKKPAKKKPAKKAPAKKAPAKKAPAKKPAAGATPGYMKSTASSRAKQKPPAKKK